MTETATILQALPDVMISALVKQLRVGVPHEMITAQIIELHPADIADLFAKVDEEERSAFLQMIGEQLDSLTLTYLEADLAQNIITQLPAKTAGKLIAELDSDDALELVETLDEEQRRPILRELSSQMRSFVEAGLQFPEDSAGRLMQRETVAVPQVWTVGKTLDFLRAAGDELPESFLDIFIVDPMHRMVGEVTLNQILRSQRSVRLQDIARDDLHPIPAVMDQEDVADIFRRDSLVSAPVVNDNGRLIGVITIDDIVDVIDEEAQEDFLKLGGVAAGDMYRAVFDTARARFTWLFVNLLTAVLASLVIGLFAATLEQIVALAILMPIVASMGGNAGTQALTIAVRALATKQLSSTNAMRVISKELMVGVLNGVAFAILIGLIAGLWFSSLPLGLVIAAAMVVNLIVAGVFGISIPLVLQRMNIDPALASAVFLTTITDVVGFFAFLGLAAMVML